MGTELSGANFIPPVKSKELSLQPANIATLDLNYDFKMDLLLIESDTLRFWLQSKEGSFVETNDYFQGNLPNTPSGYYGIWTYDHEADGDLDLLAATEDGPPVLVLKGDKFSPVNGSPFPWTKSMRDFVFVDLNGDGRADASALDSRGQLQIYFNLGSGEYKRAPLFTLPPKILALNSGDLNRNSYLELFALYTSGSVYSLEYSHLDNSWKVNMVLTATLPLKPISGNHLILADMDNNGQQDFIISDSIWTSVLLADGEDSYIQLDFKDIKSYAAVDVNHDGRLDLWGLTVGGKEIQLLQKKTNDYHWQSFNIQAKSATGDRRINSFGIGGEAEVRYGLFYQKIPILKPLLHFGLGSESSLDITRVLWVQWPVH